MYGKRSADLLNRTVKLAMDQGDASSWDEASALFQQYRLQVICGPKLSESPTLQAALLTIVNTAARCFLGGVIVVQCPDAALLVSWKGFESLHDSIGSLGGTLQQTHDPSIPTVQLDMSVEVTGFSVRLFYNGWNGGVVPAQDFTDAMRYGAEFVLSGITAGAIAVSEAFQHIRQSNVAAGQRAVGVSLFVPGEDFLSADAGPELSFLPNNLWLIGLGHIGQALLWSLGLLPYGSGVLKLRIQDFDQLTEANESTSPLTFNSLVGLKKTRAMAAWCEERGFEAAIIERPFGDDFRVTDDEPPVALCAVDNALARSVLEKVGFQQIIEGGLGSTAEEYLAFRLHTFPGEKSAAAIWGTAGPEYVANEILARSAYVSLLAEGEDPCGVTMLAGKAVGASFVGTFLSTLMIGELLRQLHGGSRLCLIDGTLRSNKMRQFNSEVVVDTIPSFEIRKEEVPTSSQTNPEEETYVNVIALHANI